MYQNISLVKMNNACNCIILNKSLIQALVISRLDYCCSLLLGTKKANIDHLQRLQNSAARFIFDIPQYESAKPYLQQLHWLPVQERIHFRILTYVFKCLNSQVPKYLSELLHTHQSSRDTRSSKEYRLNQLVIPNRFSKKAFSYMGPVLWNNLDNSIRTATTVDKKKFTTVDFNYNIIIVFYNIVKALWVIIIKRYGNNNKKNNKKFSILREITVRGTPLYVWFWKFSYCTVLLLVWTALRVVPLALMISLYWGHKSNSMLSCFLCDIIILSLLCKSDYNFLKYWNIIQFK